MTFEKRFSSLDWDALNAGLLQRGYAVIDELFSGSECENMQQLYDQAALFRKTVNMAEHDFGNGEYKYFAYPLPELVQITRLTLYAPLSTLANEWAALFNAEPGCHNHTHSFVDYC